MSGTNFAFNIAKHKLGYYFDTTLNGGSILVCLFNNSGYEGDAGCMDRATLSAVTANSAECSYIGSTNGGRQTLTGISAGGGSVVNASDWVIITATNPVFQSLTGGTLPSGNPAVAKLIMAYKPSGGNDSNSIPLLAFSFDFTPDGTDVTANIVNQFVKIA